MIDEVATFEMFGYTSDELKPRSGKKVAAICDECGVCRVIRKSQYRDLCHPCANKTPEHRHRISEANRGKTPRLGTHHTEETKQKISRSRRGKVCGAKNGRWKGGVGGWRKAIYRTQAYKNWRTAVFERDDYTCQMCGNLGSYLEAHHIQPVRDHKNDLLVYDVHNGITLCKKCHDVTKGAEYDFIDKFTVLLGEK